MPTYYVDTCVVSANLDVGYDCTLHVSCANGLQQDLPILTTVDTCGCHHVVSGVPEYACDGTMGTPDAGTDAAVEAGAVDGSTDADAAGLD